MKLILYTGATFREMKPGAYFGRWQHLEFKLNGTEIPDQQYSVETEIFAASHALVGYLEKRIIES